MPARSVYSRDGAAFSHDFENGVCHTLSSSFPANLHPRNPLLSTSMSLSDFGNKIAVGLESTNLRERAKFYADRNQIETAVFFAGI